MVIPSSVLCSTAPHLLRWFDTDVERQEVDIASPSRYCAGLPQLPSTGTTLALLRSGGGAVRSRGAPSASRIAEPVRRQYLDLLVPLECDMDTLFKSSSNFASLSLKDLAEARNLFHYHLMNKKNVVATALGLYRVRKSDPWPTKDDPDAATPRTRTGERRTLFNSEVRPYSWPCVYVFVSTWEHERALSESNPSDVVPKSLFLPDGRAVPVCVIEARKQHFSKDMQVRKAARAPRNLLGPGSTILNKNGQGLTRLGTAGCIVRDGETFYVLTNRHVAGAPGTPISAWLPHREPEIGVSAPKGTTREDFGKIY